MVLKTVLDYLLLQEDLLDGYTKPAFQNELHKEWRAAGDKPIKKAAARRRACLKVQGPLLKKHGLDVSWAGVLESMRASGDVINDPEIRLKQMLLAWLVDPDAQIAEPISGLREGCDLASAVERWKTEIELGLGRTPVVERLPAVDRICRQYQRDGFFAPLEGLDSKEVADALAGFMRFEEKHRARVDEDSVTVMHHAWLPWLRNLARHPAIVGAVMGAFQTNNREDIYLYNTQLLARPAGKSLKTHMGVDWHKDGDLYTSHLAPIDRMHLVTVFVALSMCDRHHGCIRARPTSKGGEVGLQEIDLELRPGELSLHGPSTVHTAGLNMSCETRYCVALRYIRASTRCLHASSLGCECVLTMDGSASGTRRSHGPENFTAMPELPGEATEEGLALRERMLQRRRAARMQDPTDISSGLALLGNRCLVSGAAH